MTKSDNQNNWDPAHFEQVFEQRVIDGAVQAAIDALHAEYAKTGKALPPDAEQKLRLMIATNMRGNLKRRPLRDE